MNLKHCSFIVASAVLTIATMTVSAQSVSTLTGEIQASGGVAFGPDGNIYVANFGDTLSNANGNQVLRVTPEGDVSVFATGLAGASGNAFDSQGNLIQSNIAGGRISSIAPDGTVTTIAANGINGPVGVAVDVDDTVFIANCGDSTIRRINASGAGVLVAAGFPLNCPNGLTIDPDGNLYTVNFGNGQVIRITQDGQTSILATTPASTFRPGGGNGHVTFGNGRLYLVSNASSQVFELTLDGQLTVIAGDGSRGHNDGPLLESSFSFPNGIDISPNGRFLYINESVSTAQVVLNGNTFPLTPNFLRVVDLGVDFVINAGLTGAWFNPATVGQGMLFDVIPSTEVLFLAWFTFAAPDGSKIGAAEHRWLTAQGPYVDNVAELTITLSEGGVFDDPTMVSNSTVGTATLSFEDCLTAHFSYDFDDGTSGEFDLTRLTPDVLCSVLSEP